MRYCSLRIRLPWISRNFFPYYKNFLIKNHYISSFFHPFTNSFPCYAGEAWWIANRKSALHILDFYNRDASLGKYCKNIICPEECYFQTVLGNANELTLSQDIFRYIDWTMHGDNPKILTEKDCVDILTSNALFARKMSHPRSKLLLDKIDKDILQF